MSTYNKMSKFVPREIAAGWFKDNYKFDYQNRIREDMKSANVYIGNGNRNLAERSLESALDNAKEGGLLIPSCKLKDMEKRIERMRM